VEHACTNNDMDKARVFFCAIAFLPASLESLCPSVRTSVLRTARIGSLLNLIMENSTKNCQIISGITKSVKS
jgi:hypothetical protein